MVFTESIVQIFKKIEFNPSDDKNHVAKQEPTPTLCIDQLALLDCCKCRAQAPKVLARLMRNAPSLLLLMFNTPDMHVLQKKQSCVKAQIWNHMSLHRQNGNQKVKRVLPHGRKPASKIFSVETEAFKQSI